MPFISLNSLKPLLSLPKEVVRAELRLDLFSDLDFTLLQQALTSSPVDLLFTLRKASQGGKFAGSEKERTDLIRKLLSLKPAFFDLEYDMDPDFILEQIKLHKDVKFILSYHNFTEMPGDLESLCQKMFLFPVYGYKLAALANSTNDALRLLLLAKKHPKVSVIPMGDTGSFGRILSFTLENKLSYSYLSSSGPCAPGQISLEELIKIYRYPDLNSTTELYGLIGDPVAFSIGHLYHNEAFAKKGVNAVYLKMKVTEEELPDFFTLAGQLGFKGLSVTMPLKEKVLSFIDRFDPDAEAIGAINTIAFQKDGIYGTNTDGKGALDALESVISVKGKTLVIIGAGGSSKAITFEAIKRGAAVYIANRTLSKAKQLADLLGCFAVSLSDIPPEYDILLNTAPDLVAIDNIPSSAVVMDIVYSPEKTPFLERALQAGCRVVYGKEMFFQQAALQSKLWCKS